MFRPRHAIIAAGLLLFLGVWVKNAWVCDDAYINARVLEQLFAGNGPNWNPHQRAQVYTSPLWLWFQVPLRAASCDFHANVLAFSLAWCAALLVLLRRLVASSLAWLVLVVLMVGARGFMDFTSSGLEMPLVFVACACLLGWYLAAAAATPASPAAAMPTRWLVVGAGCALLIRHDLAVLWCVPVAQTIWRHRALRTRARWWRLLAIAAAPLVLWSAFAVFYYGSPVPNAAVARWHAGVPMGVVLGQGAHYLFNTIHDPVLAVVLALGGACALARRATRAVGMGMALHGAYLVCVGGDFMAGRFLGGVFLVGAVLLVREFTRLSRVKSLASQAAVIAVVVLVPGTPARAPADYVCECYNHLVADERGIYFQWTSLWARWRTPPGEFPAHPWAEQARLARAQGQVLTTAGDGLFGYTVGTRVTDVDHLGVLDPFIARLAGNLAREPYRPNHVVRDLPAGYLESLATGEDRLVDPRLRLLYHDVHLATSAPLLAPGRARAIWRLTVGSPLGGPSVNPDLP